ncbi:hypothetical protein SAMN02910353_01305 [Ruminococcus sp. YRD2003]|uniref:hypothetical protein n=1 Tax=Ruminococcus sp. YRD2003 TaxID=1452313 RepID=UPI0008C077E8|nr:hypothetical protein SAMN02910353_01305 [Ruminococcus flavefaciens]
MPLSYEEFMKKTGNKGFSPEEQELLGTFASALELTYDALSYEDKNSEEYKEHTELREALEGLRDNSVLEPSSDEDEDEKKKKWDEDMQRLVGFINMLRSGRNLSYFSDHAIGPRNGQLKNGQQYFSLLELLNDKLEAKLEADKHREYFEDHQPRTVQVEKPQNTEKEEKEPVDEATRLELEEAKHKEQEKILEEWSYIGNRDESDTFLNDLLKASKGLNAKHWKVIGEKTDELNELKSAIGEYNIYLMEKNDGNASEHDEEKYLKAIVKAAENYIQKKRGDDLMHPEKNKAPDWKPLLKKNRVRFEAALEILELAEKRLDSVKEKNIEAESTVNEPEVSQPEQKEPRRSLKDKVRKNVKHAAPAMNNAEKKPAAVKALKNRIANVKEGGSVKKELSNTRDKTQKTVTKSKTERDHTVKHAKGPGLK